MAGQDHHWVQDLFPPKFTFEDHYELTVPIEGVRTRLDKLLDKVTSVDTEAIRDIYIRVLAMVTAQDREKHAVSRLVDVETQTDVTSSTESPTSDRTKANTETGLWTSLEYKMLKDHYVREHEQFVGLRAEIDDLTRDNNSSTEKYKTLKNEFTKSRDEIHHKDALIERLKLVNTSLKDEIVRITNQLSDVEAELKQTKSSYRETLSENKHQSTLINDFELRCKITENKFATVHDTAALEIDRQTAAMQIKHDTEVADLTDRINNLVESLEEEQRLHSRCKQGLDMLRLHYSQSDTVQNFI